MQRAGTGWRRLTALGAIAVLTAAACGSSTTGNGKSVTVIGTPAFTCSTNIGITEPRDIITLP